MLLVFGNMQSEGPTAFIRSLTGRIVKVKLGSSSILQGRLELLDKDFNLILRDATETLQGQAVATHGHVLIRGNSVLYITKASS